MMRMESGGAYTAERAAALSGVPRSTVHYWAVKRYLVPSVSEERVKLWSYADLLGLRTIYWLRRPKRARDGYEIRPTAMRAVRHALQKLRDLDLDLFELGRPSIAVDRAGEVYITPPGAAPRTPNGQVVSAEVIDLIAPFSSLEGGRGPDLREPSTFVRILPRKLSGEPHVVDTRIETQALYALECREFSMDKIARLYPVLDQAAIEDALRVERQLSANLTLRAA